MMKQATLCVLVQREAPEVLLGMKKRGFGQGKYNGFGGKVIDGEDLESAAIRELFEETGVQVRNGALQKAAELTFYFTQKPKWNQVVHVYVVYHWNGSPQESEEMKPEWFKFSGIPYAKMWKDDSYWLPLVLQGKKVTGTFTFGEDNESVVEYELLEK